MLDSIMNRNPSPMGELALIEQIRKAFPPTDKTLALGIGDDCAILRPLPGHEILVTTDFSLENRHFRRDLHPPASIGYRCLARGLSDLAAMGATPLTAFLSLALPASMPRTLSGRRWIDGFFSGLRTLAVEHNITLAGGDTSESPADLILADIVLIGSAPRNRSLRRSGAHPGDILYVTGALGGAHAELTALLESNRPSHLKTACPNHPHLYPQPRIAVGATLLRRRLATAAIDISDGLSTDLTHLCEASGVRAEIDSSALPLHQLTASLPPAQAIDAALHGGEDYELLFAAPPKAGIPRRIAGVPITRICTLLPQQKNKPIVTLIRPDKPPTDLQPAGWQHFSR